MESMGMQSFTPLRKARASQSLFLWNSRFTQNVCKEFHYRISWKFHKRLRR